MLVSRGGCRAAVSPCAEDGFLQLRVSTLGARNDRTKAQIHGRIPEQVGRTPALNMNIAAGHQQNE
jgi:hypothetical protein